VPARRGSQKGGSGILKRNNLWVQSHSNSPPTFLHVDKRIAQYDNMTQYYDLQEAQNASFAEGMFPFGQ
jgi:hypothetical protein